MVRGSLLVKNHHYTRMGCDGISLRAALWDGPYATPIGAIVGAAQNMLTRQVQDGYLDEWQQRAARYALRVSRSVVVSLSLSRRNAASESEENCELRPAACVFQLLPHMDTGGCSSDGDALHGPVFHGRAGTMPVASTFRIWPNGQ